MYILIIRTYELELQTRDDDVEVTLEVAKVICSTNPLRHTARVTSNELARPVPLPVPASDNSPASLPWSCNIIGLEVDVAALPSPIITIIGPLEEASSTRLSTVTQTAEPTKPPRISHTPTIPTRSAGETGT